ncbi:MAG: hypothetical protein WC775_05465 [Patescibacteria group bacterium]|jgi:hypothetical protein
MSEIDILKDKLRSLLGVAQYPDQEKFIADFIEMTVKEAVLDVTETLNEEQTQQIETLLKETASPDEYLDKLLQVVDQNAFKEKLAKRAETAFKQLLDAMIPHLDPTQATQLVAALQK